ncbi:MAG: DUF3422 family protein [Halobacteria archaeon]
MPPKVDRRKCNNCGLCATICPSDVYGIVGGKAEVVNPQNCIECGECVKKCPVGAITLFEDLHKQIIRSILKQFSLPAHVNVLCYTFDGRDRYAIKEEFKKIALSIGFLESEITWEKYAAFGVKKIADCELMVKLNLTSNYFIYQFWQMGGKSEFGKLPMLSAIAFPTESRLSELDILIMEGEFSDLEIAALLPGSERFAGEYFDSLKVFTRFEPDSEGRERYFIFSLEKELLQKHAESIVDNLIRIENYFHLIALPRDKFEIAVDRLFKIENEIGERFRIIKAKLDAATPQIVREWLYELMAKLAETADISEEFRHILADAVIHGESLQNLLQNLRWGEIKGYTSISTPLVRGWISIQNDYQRFVARIEEIKDEISDIIAVLNMKINLMTQEQSYQLQRSMHETQIMQMRMQHTIEGLYVVFAAFYLTELGHFIFEALEAQRIAPFSSTILTVLFIPVALLLALAIAGKLRLKSPKAQ